MIDRKTKPSRYVLCLRNDGYAASLEVRKLYQMLPASPNEEGFVRVIDESGDDYLYPADFFVALDLPGVIEETLRKAA